jgi:signal transduction histidine kinase
MRKLILIYFFIFPLSQAVFSQKYSTAIDSLIQVAENPKSHDTLKIKIFGDVTWELMGIDINKSLQFAQKAIELSEKIKSKEFLAQAHSDIGSVYNRLTVFDKAKYHYLEALKLRKELGHDIKIAGIYSNIATILIRQSEHEEALEYSFQSLKKYEEIGDITQQTKILGNISIIYSELQQLESALKFSRKCLDLSRKNNIKIMEAQSMMQIGAYHFEKIEMDSALYYLTAAKDIFEEIGYIYELGGIYSNIGRLYFNQDKLVEAENFILKGLEYREKVGDSLGIGMSFINLGELEQRKKNVNLSNEFLNKSLKIFVDNNGFIHIKRIYALLIENAIATKDFSKAVDLYQIYDVYKDSLYDTNISNELTKMQVLYETEKKEAENLILKQDNDIKLLEIERKNRAIIILFVSILIILLAVWLVINQINLKKKQQELESKLKLQKEKERISRDLHDNVGGQLSFVLYSTESLDSNELEKNPHIVEDINASVKSVISNLRETIWAINDEEISIQDISDKLKVYAKNILRYTNTKVVFQDDISGNINYNSSKGLNIYRICQEIINNVFKHAKAEELKISFYADNKHQKIIISDNGKGFNKENIEAGNGLNNISQRAKETEINVVCESENGTKYTLIV